MRGLQSSSADGHLHSGELCDPADGAAARRPGPCLGQVESEPRAERLRLHCGSGVSRCGGAARATVDRSRYSLCMFEECGRSTDTGRDGLRAWGEVEKLDADSQHQLVPWLWYARELNTYR